MYKVAAALTSVLLFFFVPRPVFADVIICDDPPSGQFGTACGVDPVIWDFDLGMCEAPEDQITQLTCSVFHSILRDLSNETSKKTGAFSGQSCANTDPNVDDCGTAGISCGEGAFKACTKGTTILLAGIQVSVGTTGATAGNVFAVTHNCDFPGGYNSTGVCESEAGVFINGAFVEIPSAIAGFDDSGGYRAGVFFYEGNKTGVEGYNHQHRVYVGNQQKLCVRDDSPPNVLSCGAPNLPSLPL